MKMLFLSLHRCLLKWDMVVGLILRFTTVLPQLGIYYNNLKFKS
jgi:hypothetical protein